MLISGKERLIVRKKLFTLTMKHAIIYRYEK